MAEEVEDNPERNMGNRPHTGNVDAIFRIGRHVSADSETAKRPEEDFFWLPPATLGGDKVAYLVQEHDRPRAGTGYEEVISELSEAGTASCSTDAGYYWPDEEEGVGEDRHCGPVSPEAGRQSYIFDVPAAATTSQRGISVCVLE